MVPFSEEKVLLVFGLLVLLLSIATGIFVWRALWRRLDRRLLKWWLAASLLWLPLALTGGLFTFIPSWAWHIAGWALLGLAIILFLVHHVLTWAVVISRRRQKSRLRKAIIEGCRELADDEQNRDWW